MTEASVVQGQFEKPIVPTEAPPTIGCAAVQNHALLHIEGFGLKVKSCGEMEIVEPWNIGHRFLYRDLVDAVQVKRSIAKDSITGERKRAADSGCVRPIAAELVPCEQIQRLSRRVLLQRSPWRRWIASSKRRRQQRLLRSVVSLPFDEAYSPCCFDRLAVFHCRLEFPTGQ